jgi:hypothetical protein
MQLNVKTILNLKEKHPHFVYHDVRLTSAEDPKIEVKVEPRRGSKGICSGCGPGLGRDVKGGPRWADQPPFRHIGNRCILI